MQDKELPKFMTAHRAALILKNIVDEQILWDSSCASPDVVDEEIKSLKECADLVAYLRREETAHFKQDLIDSASFGSDKP